MGAPDLATAALTFENFPSLKSHFLQGTGPFGAILGIALFGSVLLAAWRSASRFQDQGSLGEAAYVVGLSAALLGALFAGFFCPASAFPAPGWLVWPLAGILGGLSLLAEKGPVTVLPLAWGEKTRRLAYGPLLAAALALGVFPVLWFRSDIHHNAGVWHARQKHWDLAMAEWDRVRPDAPAYVMASYFKGNVYLESGKPERALEQFALVQSQSPDYARVHFQKAWPPEAGDWAGAGRFRRPSGRIDSPSAYRKLAEAALAGHLDRPPRRAPRSPWNPPGPTGRPWPRFLSRRNEGPKLAASSVKGSS